MPQATGIKILISPSEEIPLDHIRSIYDACRWGWPSTDALVQKAFENTFVRVIAYDGDIPVGFARAISDGLAYALVVDTMIIPQKRGSGLGTAIMKVILEYLKQSGIGFVKLISSKEGKEMYEKLGFKARSQEEPGMILSLR